MYGAFGGLLAILAILTARENPATALLWALLFVVVAVPLEYYHII